MPRGRPGPPNLAIALVTPVGKDDAERECAVGSALSASTWLATPAKRPTEYVKPTWAHCPAIPSEACSQFPRRRPDFRGGAHFASEQCSDCGMSLDHLTDQLAAAARDLGSENVEQTLDKAVGLAVELIDGCDACGVGLVRRGKSMDTPAYTHDVALRGDELQYELQEGPCMDAVWENEIVTPIGGRLSGTRRSPAGAERRGGRDGKTRGGWGANDRHCPRGGASRAMGTGTAVEDTDQSGGALPCRCATFHSPSSRR